MNQSKHTERDLSYAAYSGYWARFYDHLWPENPTETSFFKHHVKAANGKALEVGCGTGRILVPLVKSGLIDLHGFDASQEMLDVCKKKLQTSSTKLFTQKMQSLSLSESYSIIYAPNNIFILLRDHDEVIQSLKKIHKHLTNGGCFFATLPAPHHYKLRTQNEQLMKEVTGLSDFQRLRLFGSTETHFVEQLSFDRYRIEVTNTEGVTNSETCEFRLRWYYKHEFIAMLRQAGFQDIQVKGDYSDEPLADSHKHMVFSARK